MSIAYEQSEWRDQADEKIVSVIEGYGVRILVLYHL